MKYFIIGLVVISSVRAFAGHDCEFSLKSLNSYGKSGIEFVSLIQSAQTCGLIALDVSVSPKTDIEVTRGVLSFRAIENRRSMCMNSFGHESGVLDLKNRLEKHKSYAVFINEKYCGDVLHEEEDMIIIK